jgi:hypothetical protein
MMDSQLLAKVAPKIIETEAEYLGLKEGDQEIVNSILQGDCNINAEQADILGKYFYVPSSLFV